MDLYAGQVFSLSLMIFTGWHNNQTNTTVLIPTGFIPTGQKMRSNGFNLQTATHVLNKSLAHSERHFLWIYDRQLGALSPFRVSPGQRSASGIRNKVKWMSRRRLN